MAQPEKAAIAFLSSTSLVAETWRAAMGTLTLIVCPGCNNTVPYSDLGLHYPVSCLILAPVDKKPSANRPTHVNRAPLSGAPVAVTAQHVFRD